MSIILNLCSFLLNKIRDTDIMFKIIFVHNILLGDIQRDLICLHLFQDLTKYEVILYISSFVILSNRLVQNTDRPT